MDNPNCADGKTPDYNSETYQAEVGDLRNQYEVILAKALAENPVKPPTGKRGITKQSKATNLIFRLLDDSDDVWRFMTQVGVPFTNNLAAGWNLMGNGTDQAFAALFGNTAQVSTVWKWDAVNRRWLFYSPSMTASALQTYITTYGYGTFEQINAGEGFWVDAKATFTLPAGKAVPASHFRAGQAKELQHAWNLVAIGSTITPSAFNVGISTTPPSAGEFPINVTALWAWDNPQRKWYFYAPSLANQGGTALTDFVTSKGYLDFAATNKLLGPGIGFWVNKP